jgi:Bacterial regulatory proteins, lacI family
MLGGETYVSGKQTNGHLREVAELAAVSIATASMVLRGAVTFGNRLIQA